MRFHDIIDPVPGGPGADATLEEKRIWTDFEETCYALAMLELGLAHRRAGLIWFTPLCHDGFDY